MYLFRSALPLTLYICVFVFLCNSFLFVFIFLAIDLSALSFVVNKSSIHKRCEFHRLIHFVLFAFRTIVFLVLCVYVWVSEYIFSNKHDKYIVINSRSRDDFNAFQLLDLVVVLEGRFCLNSINGNDDNAEKDYIDKN